MSPSRPFFKRTTYGKRRVRDSITPQKTKVVIPSIEFDPIGAPRYKITRMSKILWLLLLFVLPAHAQVVTGRPGSRLAKTFVLSAQILHEGSFQLQRSDPGFTNWLVLTNFNALPGTNTYL